MNNSFVQTKKCFTWAWKPALLMAVTIVCVAAYWLGFSYKHKPLDSGLEVAANDLDVGEVWEQQHFQCKMTIQNTTAKDATIDGFHSTCECVSVDPSTLTIRSGQKDDVHVTLNLQLGPRKDSDDFQVQITPFKGDESNPLASWTIRGRVRRLLSLKPEKVSFYGKELIQGQSFASETVIATAAVSLDSLGTKCSTDYAKIQVIPNKQRTSEFEIIITPAKTLPIGPFRFEILLEPKGNNAQYYPSLLLPVEGSITSDVDALPDSLVMGPGKVGDTISENITLISASNKPFEVVKIETSSQAITVKSVSIPGFSGKSFRIEQQISKMGKHSSFVRFLVRKNGEDSTVIIKIIYLGTSS
jgi:hypothetical protein